MGKAPFFSSIREKKVSVQVAVLFEITDSPRVHGDRNTALEIDLGCLLVVAREENFNIIYILEPGFCDQIGSLFIHILRAGNEG